MQMDFQNALFAAWTETVRVLKEHHWTAGSCTIAFEVMDDCWN
jgi:hypothetical protein